MEPRPADSPTRPASDLPEPADDRGDIGENFCQPPLLPFSRPEIDPPELPDLEANPEFPRASDGRAASRLFPVDLPFAVALVLPCAEKKC